MGRVKQKINIKQSQLLTWKRVAMVVSVSSIIAGITVLLSNLSYTKRAFAVDCSTTYQLDWSVPATYTVNCGSVNASNWTVKNDSCNYYSPVTNVGGPIGGPSRTTDIAVRVNQSGNLSNNDFAYIMIYVNGSLFSSSTARGDTGAAVFSVSTSITVPSGGNFQVRVATKTDKNTEFWQIKNGDVTACVQSLAPLPVSVKSFTGYSTSEGTLLKWVTSTEVNNDYFTILRSVDAQNYSEVAKISGHGTTSLEHSYSFTDSERPNGVCYYMLSQTDYDGKTEKFGPIVIRENKKINSNNGAIYPNPFKDHFTVVFETNKEGSGIMLLQDIKGSIADQVVIETTNGLNRIPYTPTTPLSKGIYFVKVLSGNEQVAICKVFKE